MQHSRNILEDFHLILFFLQMEIYLAQAQLHKEVLAMLKQVLLLQQVSSDKYVNGSHECEHTCTHCCNIFFL